MVIHWLGMFEKMLIAQVHPDFYHAPIAQSNADYVVNLAAVRHASAHKAF